MGAIAPTNSPGEFVLIILDPCYKLLLGRDENKAGDIASLMDEFEVVAVENRRGSGFGAHYSKGNQAQKESIDRIGGSGVFARDPDSILNFTHHEQPDCFAVEMTLRNHPPQDPFVVKWEFPLFRRFDSRPGQSQNARTPETEPGERANGLNRQAALGDRNRQVSEQTEPRFRAEQCSNCSAI